MAVDSANKRRDIAGLPPIPDGSLASAADRRQIADVYSGFGTGAVITVTGYLSAGQVYEQIVYRLGDTATSIWNFDEILVYMQEGYDQLVSLTGCLWIKISPTTLQDVAGTAIYTLPTDLITLERITWKQKRMFPLDPERLERTNPAYGTLEGDVYGYTMELDGLRSLRKVMVPAVTETGNISIEYQRIGNALADYSSQFELPNRYVKYVRHFAMWKALERNGPGQDLKLASHYKERYKAGVGRMLARKTALNANQTRSFEGSVNILGTKPPRPRMPWAYGQVVR